MIRQYISTGSLDRLVLPKIIRGARIDSFWISSFLKSSKYASIGSSRALFLFLLMLCKDSVTYIISASKGFSGFYWSGDTRIWTGEKGFAVPRLTTRPCRQNEKNRWKYSLTKNPPFFDWSRALLFIVSQTIIKTHNA